MARTLLVVLLIAGALCATAQAAPTTAMQSAVERYGHTYATDQGWQYLRLLPSMRGDWRRGHFWLLFDATDRADSSPNVEFDLRVEAVAQRCGPGWFTVSSPLDLNGCPAYWKW